MSYQPDYRDLDAATKAQVREWMRMAMALTPQDFPHSTALAEACGDALGLADSSMHAVIPEDVYEIAAEFFPED